MEQQTEETTAGSMVLTKAGASVGKMDAVMAEMLADELVVWKDVEKVEMKASSRDIWMEFESAWTKVLERVASWEI